MTRPLKMSFENWRDITNEFQVADARGISGSLFPGLKKRAEQMPIHEGLHIIQSFEPIPLYEVMEQLGFQRFTDQVATDGYPYILLSYRRKKGRGRYRH